MLIVRARARANPVLRSLLIVLAVLIVLWLAWLTGSMRLGALASVDRWRQITVMGPNLIFGRPPVILPVKPHPCARTQPPAPFRTTVSVKIRLARPYWNEPVISRPIRCRSRNARRLHGRPIEFETERD